MSRCQTPPPTLVLDSLLSAEPELFGPIIEQAFRMGLGQLIVGLPLTLLVLFVSGFGVLGWQVFS